MADLGLVRAYLGGLPQEQRRAFTSLFEYLLKNWRVGLPGHQGVAPNMAWVQLTSTTAVDAGVEFAVRHGLAVAPKVAFPALDLTSSGGQFVAVTVSRPADATYVYLRSTSTGVPFVLFVEQR